MDDSVAGRLYFVEVLKGGVARVHTDEFRNISDVRSWGGEEDALKMPSNNLLPHCISIRIVEEDLDGQGLRACYSLYGSADSVGVVFEDLSQHICQEVLKPSPLFSPPPI